MKCDYQFNLPSNYHAHQTGERDFLLLLSFWLFVDYWWWYNLNSTNDWKFVHYTRKKKTTNKDGLLDE